MMPMPDDFQDLHDRVHPEMAANVARKAVRRVREHLVRKAVVAELIALEVEPDEVLVSEIARDIAPHFYVATDGFGLHLNDGTRHPTPETIRIEVRTALNQLNHAEGP